jgi:hypothetical protein
MDDRELLENVKSLLRQAIASRLKIAKADFDASFDTQTAVNRLLTSVMSIGYNKGDMDAVLEELCTARHFGDEDNKAVVDAMRKEVVATQDKLGFEIAAFAKMHELNQAGAPPEATWAQIQSMVVLGED